MRPLLSLVMLAASAQTFKVPNSQDNQSWQHIFANPAEDNSHRIPTSYESAIMGRRILALTPLGTLSTVFPSTTREDTEEHEVGTMMEHRPADVGGLPVGLIDYIADCEGDGNPTILSIKIATSFKNVRAGSNISLSMHWTPPYPPDERIGDVSSAGDDDPVASRTIYSAANQPRFSLMGYLEPIPEAANERGLSALAKCFVATHPDAKYWLPGNHIHKSEFVRLVVTHVYWVGGFGDRAYIGWIPKEEWHKVTAEEWQAIELPGEKKGWKEWDTTAAAAIMPVQHAEEFRGLWWRSDSAVLVYLYALLMVGLIGGVRYGLRRRMSSNDKNEKWQEYDNEQLKC